MEIIKDKRGITGRCVESPSLLYIISLLVLGMLIGGLLLTPQLIKSEKEVLKKQFENIKLCLNDEDVTKDLMGAFINEDGKVECHYGIGNGLIKRKVLGTTEVPTR